MAGTITEKAAETACRWLHGRGFRVEECLEDDGKGEKLNAWIALRRANDGSKFKGTSNSFPTWDWAGRRRKRADAWLYAINWLFLEGGDGPTATESVSTREMAPGWTRREKKTLPVPKFRFSSLEEFVLKAEASGEFAGK